MKKIEATRLFLLLLLLLPLSLLATKSPLKELSVQLLWKHQFEFAGFYMAKEKGLITAFK